MSRWVAALAAALTLVSLAGVGSGPAQGAQGETDPRPPRLVEQTPWLAEDAPLDLGFRTGATLPEGGSIEVTLYGAVTDRAVIDGGGADPATLGPVRDVLSVPTAIVPTDGDGVHRLRIATDGSAAGLPLGDPGVYPLRLEVRTAAGLAGPALSTFVVRPAADAAATPLATAVVLPLHGSPSHGLDGEARLTPRTRRLLDERVRILRDHPDVAVTVVPTPETMEALAATDATLADRVRGALAARHVVAGPYVRLDLGGWAGVPELAADLQGQFGTGERTLEGVLARPVDRRTWVGFGNPTPAALDALAVSGRDRAVFGLETVIGATRPVTEPVVVTGTTGQAIPAVLSDPALRGQAADTDDPVLVAHRMLATLAFLGATIDQGGGAATGVDDGVVISLPAIRPLAPALLDTLLQALGTPGAPAWAVTLEDLFRADPAGDPGAEPGPVVRGVTQPGPDLRGYALALGATQGPVAGYTSSPVARTT